MLLHDWLNSIEGGNLREFYTWLAPIFPTLESHYLYYFSVNILNKKKSVYLRLDISGSVYLSNHESPKPLRRVAIIVV